MPVNVSGVFARRLRIEHNDPGTYGGACSPGLTMAKVITIIRDEHRSIAAILHGMQYLVNEIREYGSKVDLRVFWAMLYYLDTFSERMHHPKEDRYLFQALKERTGEGTEVIAELEREHASGRQALKELEQCLARFQEGGMREFPGFAEGVDKFVSGYWDHMRKEEEQVLPLAEKALSPEDWKKIDRAFEENRDPLAADRETKDFQKLFSRIVNLAPPPIGVGPAISH